MQADFYVTTNEAFGELLLENFTVWCAHGKPGFVCFSAWTFSSTSSFVCNLPLCKLTSKATADKWQVEPKYSASFNFLAGLQVCPDTFTSTLSHWTEDKRHPVKFIFQCNIADVFELFVLQASDCPTSLYSYRYLLFWSALGIARRIILKCCLSFLS